MCAHPGKLLLCLISESLHFLPPSRIAAWFYYAKGSGVWFNMGKTWSGPDHGDAYKFFHVDKDRANGGPINEHMCEAAAKKGYDSIQFLKHHVSECKHCGDTMNYELVSTKLVGLYACTSSDGKSNLIRKGWKGANACVCDEQKGFINCAGVPFLSWDPARMSSHQVLSLSTSQPPQPGAGYG